MRVLSLQAEGEFIGDRLAGDRGTRFSQPTNHPRVLRGSLMRVGPARIAASGGGTLHVDEILDREGQSINRSLAERRPPDGRTWHPRGHQRASAAAASACNMRFESLTKPKHFLTFHTVAAVQKSGEVVAQQSSTRMQP